MKTATSRELFRQAQKLIPGGGNSPVRAFRSGGGPAPPPPHPQAIPRDREGTAGFLGDRGGDERRPAGTGRNGTGQDREVRGGLPPPRRPAAGQGPVRGA